MPNWQIIQNEINANQSAFSSIAQNSVKSVRHKYLGQLHQHTGRNVIGYYSGFLSKGGIAGSEVTADDKNGFMLAIHELDRSKGLDLIIHSQGGSIGAAESIVDYLRKMFGNDIRALVPGVAMSAGTMIALCCKSVMLAKHSNLGPIDPQINGVPALGVIEGFDRAFKEIKADALKAHIWAPILSKYSPSYLSDCENAVKWSRQFVERELQSCMFSGDSDAKAKAEAIVSALSDYERNKRHERPIHIEECTDLGIKVEEVEADEVFQDLLLSVHHCYMHALSNTSAFKIIENHSAVGFTKTSA